MDKKMRLKEPGSAITHFIGMMMAIFAGIPLLIKATDHPDRIHLICMVIFIASMIGLYAASTIFHSLDVNNTVNRILRKLDHSAIFVLIAGTYTPICVLVLKQPTGIRLCILVWVIAIVGILVKIFWITSPKWFSSVLYIGMGWVCVIAFSRLINDLTLSQFLWLVAGGVIYTIGGVIYALKLTSFNERHKYFGTHEIFHLFVMGGSVCHYIVMFKIA